MADLECGVRTIFLIFIYLSLFTAVFCLVEQIYMLKVTATEEHNEIYVFDCC